MAKKKSVHHTLTKKHRHLPWLLPVFVLVAVGSLLFFLANGPVTIVDMETPQVTVTHTVGVYNGKLPCADCSGIDAKLTLFDNGAYVYDQLYEGKNTNFTQHGSWKLVRGTPFDKEAIVYQLKPEDDGDIQNYWVQSPTKITQLDPNLNKIDSPFDLSLTLQK